jgi:hypothetical protein
VIVVDTNVISELMRGEPHPAVLSWVAAQPRALLYAIYVSQAEILYGIAALPEGRRRKVLAAAAEAMFAEDFAGRLLPFEARAAARYPEVVLTRRQAGQPEAVNSQKSWRPEPACALLARTPPADTGLRKVQNPHHSACRSISRLTLRAAFIVIVALSLGLWWAVWEVIRSLAPV